VKHCNQHKRERGVTLPLVAVFIVALFAMAALAIDLGILYTARTSAQHAADAGALAGAFTFLNPAAPQPASAQNAAVQATNANTILGQSPGITVANVNVSVDGRQVTVTVQGVGGTTVSTFFGRALGWRTVGVGAVSTAQANLAASSSWCVKPFFITNSFASGNCAQPLFTNTNGRYNLNIAVRDVNEGKEYLLSEGSAVTGILAASYYPARLSDDLSGAEYQCSIEHCINYPNCASANPVSCGQSLNLAGTHKTATKVGLDNLLQDPPLFQWQGMGQYLNGNDGKVYDFAPNVVAVPVIDDCGTTLASPYPIAGFAQLFIENVDVNAQLTVRFINAAACDAPKGTGPLTLPVQLISTGPVG
jgi:hypothetical protein